jgi:hypothetical protein
MMTTIAIYTHPSTFFFYIFNLFVFLKHSSGFCNMVVAHTHADRLTCYHRSLYLTMLRDTYSKALGKYWGRGLTDILDIVPGISYRFAFSSSRSMDPWSCSFVYFKPRSMLGSLERRIPNEREL